MVSGSSRGGSAGPNSDAGAFISTISSSSAIASAPRPVDHAASSNNNNSNNTLQPEIPPVLPHERVFPIQIGGELFKLSGASLSSDGSCYLPCLASPVSGSTRRPLSTAAPCDPGGCWVLPTIPSPTAYPPWGGSLANIVPAPSYFSQYFLLQISNAEENGADVNGAIKTLYIDRDPLTFRDIALHLQGYHVSPRDGTHFVRLFADAQFYSCMSWSYSFLGERKGEEQRSWEETPFC